MCNCNIFLYKSEIFRYNLNVTHFMNLNSLCVKGFFVYFIGGTLVNKPVMKIVICHPSLSILLCSTFLESL